VIKLTEILKDVMDNRVYDDKGEGAGYDLIKKILLILKN